MKCGYQDPNGQPKVKKQRPLKLISLDLVVNQIPYDNEGYKSND